MAQAKWYKLTPARQQLLVALVLALILLVGLLLFQFDLVGALRDAGKKDGPANGPVR